MSKAVREKRLSKSDAKRTGLSSVSWVMLLPLAIFIVLTGLFAAGLNSGDPSQLPSVLIGKPVPAFTLPALPELKGPDGGVPGFANEDLAKGKISIVNVWASWCIPCHQEHPFLMKLSENSGVPLYGLNYKDRATPARRFLGRYGNPYVAVGVDKNGKTAIDWGVYGVPETFIVNGAGHIIYKHVGPINSDIIAQKLMPAIRAADGLKPKGAGS